MILRNSFLSILKGKCEHFVSKNVFLTDRLKNVYFLSLFSLALPFTILSEEKKRERGSDHGIYCDHTGSEPGAMSGKVCCHCVGYVIYVHGII